MSHNFLKDTSFHQQLIEIDIALAEHCKAKRCPHCHGTLHQANYPRLGFGAGSHSSSYAVRLSFCCARCRRRTTPPSVRFFGRCRFIAPVFLLVCALRFSLSEQRCAQLSRRFGLVVSISTWKRWRRWWQQRFPASRFWAGAKAHLPPFLCSDPSPRRLLKCFVGSRLCERLQQLLQFLSPLTVTGC